MSYTGLLAQTVTIKGRSGHDSYGRENVGAGVNYSARFQQVSKDILLPNGEMLHIDGIVFLISTATVSTDDRLTFGGIDYKVVSKEIVIGQSSTHHIELKVQKWQA